MTSDSTPEIYPQYCFHLSPTINRYCHLRASDIASLTAHTGFGGQDVFFHINHPIKWVRVAGVIVAIDEYGAKRVYTVDDGSGVNIECLTPKPAQSAPAPTAPGEALSRALLVQDSNATEGTATAGTKPAADPTAAKAAATSQNIPDDLDVGQVVDVKGGLSVFRGVKQIQVQKFVKLRTTQQEVCFWKKIVELRETVLSGPWVLDRRIVRHCRKEAEREDDERGKGRKGREGKKKRGKDQTDEGTSDVRRIHDEPSLIRTTGLEKQREQRQQQQPKCEKRTDSLASQRNTGLESTAVQKPQAQSDSPSGTVASQRASGLEKRGGHSLKPQQSKSSGGAVSTTRNTGLGKKQPRSIEQRSAAPTTRPTGLQKVSREPYRHCAPSEGTASKRTTGLEKKSKV